MIKKMVDFVFDKSDIEEVGVKNEDIAAAAAYSQMLLYNAHQEISNVSKEDLCNTLHSEQTRLKIKEKINTLKIPLKQKFLIFYLLIGSAPRTSEWLTIVLNIEKKISYKDFWNRLMMAGETVIDRLLVDLIIEIMEIQADVECVETDDGSSDVMEKLAELISLFIEASDHEPIDSVEKIKEILENGGYSKSDAIEFIKEYCESGAAECNLDFDKLQKDDEQIYAVLGYIVYEHINAIIKEDNIDD